MRLADEAKHVLLHIVQLLNESLSIELFTTPDLLLSFNLCKFGQIITKIETIPVS